MKGASLAKQAIASSGAGRLALSRARRPLDLFSHANGKLKSTVDPRTVTAMLSEKGEQLVHLREPGPVVDELAFLRSLDKPGVRELLHVEGQGRRRQLKLLGNLPYRHALAACNDEKAKDGKARRLGQSGQRDNSGL